MVRYQLLRFHHVVHCATSATFLRTGNSFKMLSQFAGGFVGLDLRGCPKANVHAQITFLAEEKHLIACA